MRNLEGKQMLTQLPILQHLMQRLVDCKPTGQATHDPVVQVGFPSLPAAPSCPLPLMPGAHRASSMNAIY